MHPLDGYATSRADFARFINHPHAAFTDDADDFVLVEKEMHLSRDNLYAQDEENQGRCFTSVQPRSQARGGTYLPSALAYGGVVYTLTETGILNRYDAKTGKQTYKTRIDPAATAFTTSPWAYNGKLFCLSEEGQTFVIGTGEEFRLLHVNELEDMAQASPALVGDRLLIRTERRLYSIRRKT